MIFSSEKQELRLKWMFESCKNGAWGSEPDGEADVICIRAADFDGQSGRLNEGERTLRAIDPAVFEKIALRPGDLVIEKSGGGEKQLVGRTVLFDDERPSVTSNFLARCRPAGGIDPAFLNYLMLAIYTGRGTYPHIKQSTGIQNLDLGSYLDVRVSIPKLIDQQRIARFLDEKTARIDALIEKKQALLERLAEKRQALITRVVTKGLNPDVPMKPSDIEWIGNIPNHWGVKRLRFLARLISGSTPTTSVSEYWGGEIPWISPKDMKSDEISDSEDHITDFAIQEYGVRTHKDPNALIVIRGMILARTIPVVVAKGLYSINQDVKVIKSKGEVMPDYFQMYLRSVESFIFTLIAEAGHGTKALRTELFLDVPVLLPPLSEQFALTEAVKMAKVGLDSAMRSIEKSTKTLSELRSALITTAVTGQLPELNG
ncbi:restriction endonuclease subunit S [Xanthomonas sp. 3058]|uniref:restriction endonuclease subunit S n=1 Tax=Xanthomonas sp. 3058 TaxID=3035314 RepID=UPI00161DCE33|nr:restriction endonuclease subunit S [Xanthomonas sp. 3058]MBB5865682.1 type I restriction enzyme S subunit [Xanthomonas sp. 3058]